MAHIVVLGAGLGGTIMAYEMKDQLRPGDTLTVITKDPKYHFVPSNPWVAVDWRKPEDIEVDLAPVLAKKGIAFKPVAATKLAPGEQHASNSRMARPSATTTSSSPPVRNSPSTKSRGLGRRATRSRSAMSIMPRRRTRRSRPSARIPGPIIVGAVQGASCFGPAYEFTVHSRDRAAPPQDPRPGADDLRDRRALYRPSRSRRRGRHQGPARKRDARAPHQVDDQRAGQEASRPAR